MTRTICLWLSLQAIPLVTDIYKTYSKSCNLPDERYAMYVFILCWIHSKRSTQRQQMKYLYPLSDLCDDFFDSIQDFQQRHIKA